MLFETMASAEARTTASLTLQAKWFQLFQPMGGVAASAEDWAGARAASAHSATTRASAASSIRPIARIRFFSMAAFSFAFLSSGPAVLAEPHHSTGEEP